MAYNSVEIDLSSDMAVLLPLPKEGLGSRGGALVVEEDAMFILLGHDQIRTIPTEAGDAVILVI